MRYKVSQKQESKIMGQVKVGQNVPILSGASVEKIALFASYLASASNNALKKKYTLFKCVK